MARGENFKHRGDGALWFPYGPGGIPVYLAVSVIPVDEFQGSIMGYLISVGGPLAIAAIVFGWVILKGLLVTATQPDKDVERPTALILAENARLIARAEEAEAQRDEMLKTAVEQQVPVMLQFSNTTSALLPLLQDMIRRQELEEGNGHRRISRRTDN